MRIVSTPGTCGGRPRIDGHRITVEDVVKQAHNAYGRLDVDPPEHWGICRQHNVLNVPFLALYRDGTLAEYVAALEGESGGLHPPEKASPKGTGGLG